MPQLLRAFDNRNAPLVEPGKGVLALSYFNLLRLRAGAATLPIHSGPKRGGRGEPRRIAEQNDFLRVLRDLRVSIAFGSAGNFLNHHG